MDEIPRPTAWYGAKTLQIMGFQLPTSTAEHRILSINSISPYFFRGPMTPLKKLVLVTGRFPVEGVQTFPSFMFKDLQRSVFFLLKEHTQRKCFNLWVFSTIKMKLEIEKQQKHIKHKLVGGWTNPSDKYARQIDAFPQNRNKHKTYFKPLPNIQDASFPPLDCSRLSVLAIL